MRSALEIHTERQKVGATVAEEQAVGVHDSFCVDFAVFVCDGIQEAINETKVAFSTASCREKGPHSHTYRVRKESCMGSCRRAGSGQDFRQKAASHMSRHTSSVAETALRTAREPI